MKKIMFNDRYQLTDAVLAGRKTQTRRMISEKFFSLTWDVRGNTLVYENEDGDFIDIRDSKYSNYKIGEVVAIAQCYKDIGLDDFGAGYRNKMFVCADLMPHQILINGVRVERLQDISEDDCFREGIVKMVSGGENEYCSYSFYDSNKGLWSNYKTPHGAYAALINKVSKTNVWSKNPYVFVYDFKLIK